MSASFVLSRNLKVSEVSAAFIGKYGGSSFPEQNRLIDLPTLFEATRVQQASRNLLFKHNNNVAVKKPSRRSM